MTEKDKEYKSLFLTDEEVVMIEEDFFLHSKSTKKSKTGDWEDWVKQFNYFLG